MQSCFQETSGEQKVENVGRKRKRISVSTIDVARSLVWAAGSIKHGRLQKVNIHCNATTTIACSRDDLCNSGGDINLFIPPCLRPWLARVSYLR